MRRAFRIWLAVLAVTLAAPAAPFAQQAAEPQPILRVTIDPPRVVVGQQASLSIEVLAPNYMTTPPVMPDFQVRNAVTRPEASFNLVEQHDGTTFAGVHYGFAIYPQEPGSFSLAGQDIALTYAADPPQTQQATLSLPSVEFEAFIPDGAAGLDPFVAASSLTLTQSAERSADALKVGDSVKRAVTIKAEGTPAMLLPPPQLSTADGLTLYPEQPSLQERADQRTGLLTSTRLDSATYMLEKPGEYTLPAISLRWWNVETQQIETAEVEAVVLTVADDPDAIRSTAGPAAGKTGWNDFLDLVFARWPVLLGGLAALLALAWFLPRSIRYARQRYRASRAAFVASERWSFKQSKKAAHRGNPGECYDALLGWLGRFEPIAPVHTIRALKAAAGDAALSQELDTLEQRLFAPNSIGAEWSGRELIRHLGRVRSRLLREDTPTLASRALPDHLNPQSAHWPPNYRIRPVAR